jgi:hypothetical protein
MAGIVRRFRELGIVQDADRERYEAILASTRHLLNSRAAEAGVVALAYLNVFLARESLLSLFGGTWRTQGTSGIPTLAGWWFALVSYPLFLVVSYTWLWRLLIWARLLWKIARLNLRLLPTHPDLAGGLGFVDRSLHVFSIVAFGAACGPAGAIGALILFDGHKALEFKYPVLALAALIVCLITSPLLFLARPLWRARLRGHHQYSELAWSLGHCLDAKWVEAGQSQADASALAVPDFTATTDLYKVARNALRMRVLPFDLQNVGRLAVATLLPFVPLLLTQVPAKEIFDAAAKLVF